MPAESGRIHRRVELASFYPRECDGADRQLRMDADMKCIIHDQTACVVACAVLQLR